MKRTQCLLAGIYLILSLCTPLPTTAQDADTTYLDRTKRQQQFAAAFMHENPLEKPFESEDEIDIYLLSFKEAWIYKVGNEDQNVARFDPYIYPWYIYSLFSSVTQGNQPPEWAWCHVYTEYLAPSFLADFSVYSEEISKRNANLVSFGTVWMVSPFLFSCSISPTEWDEIKRSLARIPGLMDQYLENEIYARDETKGLLERVKHEVSKVSILMDIKDALIHGEVDKARTGLESAFSDSISSSYTLPLGESVWREYHARNDEINALNTLDLLARHLTAGELAPDTLQAWYSEVDPAAGLDRYAEVIDEAGLQVLIPSDQKAPMTGTYHDLYTNEQFDLASLSGKTVLLDFWATWCGPCVGEIPILQELVTEYGDHFVLVSISSDAVSNGVEKEGVLDYIKKHDIDYRVLYDEPGESLTKQFQVTGWPSKFIINPDGLLMKHPTSTHTSVKLAEVAAYLKTIQR